MTIASQIERIKANITNAYQEIEKFNVNVAEYNNKSDNLAEAISKITIGEEINNQDKTITSNGTYTADEGYTGLGKVTVNVPQESGTVADIPSGFTEYDYLAKTSGTGYIDLYCTATQDTKAEIDVTITGYNGTNANGFFGYYSSSGDNFVVTVGSETAGRKINPKIGTDTLSYSGTAVDTKYNIVMSKDGATVNNTSIGTYSSISDFTTGGSLYLFKANGLDREMYTKVYGLKLWEGDKLVHDYVPVKRNDNGVIGMYDKVTGVFYEPDSQTGFEVGEETESGGESSGGTSSGGGGDYGGGGYYR